MPNAKVLSEKQAIVEELTKRIGNATAGVLVDYKGITVLEDTALRRELRAAGIEYTVVKNTLLRFAVDKCNLNEFDSVLNGTTSLATTEGGPIAPIRIVSEFAKKNKTKNIDGNVYLSQVESFTQGKPPYPIFVSKEFLHPGERVLLIDDIQRMKQSASQEIFFNLYNKLISANKQIIITSDIHPSELKGIENRLISRFLSGLKVRVASPEFETAKAILKKKIEGRDETVMIEDEVLDFIATKFSSDVRKLEGSLNELFFKAILDNPAIIDLNFARSVFEDEPVIVMEEELNVSRIKKCVCEYYGLTQTQIESKSRTKQIANARHIAVYLCREHLQIPFVKIGIEFGNRDHSTIMSSFEKAKKLMKKDNAFNTAVRQIESKLGIQ